MNKDGRQWNRLIIESEWYNNYAQRMALGAAGKEPLFTGEVLFQFPEYFCLYLKFSPNLFYTLRCDLV